MHGIDCIDIAGDSRIRQILEFPGNYVFQAYDCETMDGWVPDTGITYYPYKYRSIYRPPSVVKAGIRSTIKHRFFKHRDFYLV